MSNKFNWNDEENEEFRDIPDEVSLDHPVQGQGAAPMYMPKTSMTREQLIVQAQQGRQVEEAVEEVAEEYEEYGEDEEEDYSEVLSDARLRLEQGRLYELVMNSDLFGETDADERAVKSVQREIKKFAKERMEIMLGMRQEKAMQAYADHNSAMAAQFNQLEVMLLRQLASKMSGGKTEEEQPEQYVAPVQAPAKRTGIKPMTSSRPTQKSQPLAKGPSAPLKRKVAAKRSPEELLGLPPESEKPIGKPVEKMTEEEKAARMQRMHERQSALKARPPANAIPMPTSHQEEMLANIRATEADKTGTVSAIMALMNAQKLS